VHDASFVQDHGLAAVVVDSPVWANAPLGITTTITENVTCRADRVGAELMISLRRV
jgi:hypothetical protein